MLSGFFPAAPRLRTNQALRCLRSGPSATQRARRDTAAGNGALGWPRRRAEAERLRRFASPASSACESRGGRENARSQPQAAARLRARASEESRDALEFAATFAGRLPSRVSLAAPPADRRERRGYSPRRESAFAERSSLPNSCRRCEAGHSRSWGQAEAPPHGKFSLPLLPASSNVAQVRRGWPTRGRHGPAAPFSHDDSEAPAPWPRFPVCRKKAQGGWRGPAASLDADGGKEPVL